MSKVLWVDNEGPPLGTEDDAVELIGEALGQDADLIAIPAQRLSADFWRLSTRTAGLFLQKLINYRLRVVIVGDISEPVAGSSALADFVRESNRGGQVSFVDSLPPESL
jgi:hypothetical protein